MVALVGHVWYPAVVADLAGLSHGIKLLEVWPVGDARAVADVSLNAIRKTVSLQHYRGRACVSLEDHEMSVGAARRVDLGHLFFGLHQAGRQRHPDIVGRAAVEDVAAVVAPSATLA